ncbi:Sensor protein KdpD [Mycobacterium pseudokansasii]|uniref:Sensor protein KdpD n=1 Tax=Mycobacterium pseudokansasii TaxID=2341080 RepID=A0A498QWM4_9MYCO|nr:Sensor protein KdpD [Mycobacterium pseudokansasii]
MSAVEPPRKRGELRIYLGAAPGVGKTYAMLGEAHRRLERGTDLVAAVIETHGRTKTAVLLDGIEIIPPHYVEYRGTMFPELDVPAVLARHPQVVLVDELAHTNTPGSKNHKRWQDVEELLDAGITVISTVNIQHLESLNDVVAQITGIQQQETVPDSVVRQAAQVELIDITPEALRRRLSHGNVYAPDKIDAALSNYFRRGNLTALSLNPWIGWWFDRRVNSENAFWPGIIRVLKSSFSSVQEGIFGAFIVYVHSRVGGV